MAVINTIDIDFHRKEEKKKEKNFGKEFGQHAIIISQKRLFGLLFSISQIINTRSYKELNNIQNSVNFSRTKRSTKANEHKSIANGLALPRSGT